MMKSKTALKSVALGVATVLLFSVLCACGTVANNKKSSGVTVEISQTSCEIDAWGGVCLLFAAASDGSEIKWSSSDETVAVVTDGEVTGKAPGQASVIATAGTAIAVCRVTVKPSNEPVAPTDPAIVAPSGYSLVWHDEFDGNALDIDKWSYQVGRRDSYNGAVGPDRWGNGELQYYTDGGNASVSDGTLKITAKKEKAGDADYTSARITTRDKADWTFGYIEARMKTPTGNGMWPAFWMLPQPTGDNGTDNEYGGWATNGEIDIMEAKGRLGNVVDTTLHFGGAWPHNKYLTKSTTLSSDTDEWHVYALEWTAQYLAWAVDGKEVLRLTNDRWYSDASTSASAPFDKPFYIIFDLAVGGTYDPDGTNAFIAAGDFTQATMYVDYVRVFGKIA